MLEQLYRQLAISIVGSTLVPFGELMIDLGKTFARLPFFKGIADACGQDIIDLTEPELAALAKNTV
jgi:lysyl-tRNA synthetase class II